MNERSFATSIAVALVALVGPVACGGSGEPPPTVAREDAAAHLRRVGTRWSEQSEEEGFLEGDPKGVAFFRIRTTSDLRLAETAASQHIRREELFRMRSGQEFHCTSEGDLPTSTHFDWKSGEVRVTVTTQAIDLPRRCNEPGFPVQAKNIGGQSVELALRGDRLVSLGTTGAKHAYIPLP